MKSLDWDDVGGMAGVVANEILEKHPFDGTYRLYGISRGGVYAAMLVEQSMRLKRAKVKLVQDVNNADILIDDLIDSGATKTKWASITHGKPFYVLLDKANFGLATEWIVFPWEHMNHEMGPEENITRILEFLGEDVKRPGLKDTPSRVVRSWDKLFSGYKYDNPTIARLLKTFEEPCDEMVLVKDIEFYSTCEHHMLPFFGKAHIAYIPKTRVVGVSKLVRLLEVYSRRLQIQERICQQVTDDLISFLNPLGAACVLEAQHFCMTSRGVEKQNSIMVTSSLTGKFREVEPRTEFLRLIGR